ncbi:RluA family pseudouridine synthase [Listeria grandensis]|uniref:Pseudouridine synthase n=1 Tax=Listeria grandensis TaxID=1494963 RepID=A0A7X0Y5V3_9LIST|nr:RluA family pseudouridine synthase [Listeria grandensis]MBC1475873.1 RluA family pseudouridine synthase [Listeria grandensis]MBC1937408.1 RluA family pseudouridine synthase [Listeria grandensis]
MYLEWHVVAEDDNLMLRTFLRNKHVSKLLLTSVKFSEDGKIEVNGNEENVLYRVKTGEHVRITFPKEQENERLLAEFGALDIVFEDDFILVLDKPAGMTSIPSQYHPSGSVANHLKGHYLNHGIDSAIHIVTRLDKETSGLMLIAKTRFSHGRLSTLHQNGHVTRKYQALVAGNLKAKSDSIVAPIGRNPESLIERAVVPDGKYAKTNYEVVASYATFDHVKIQLETGRTHQIRVHFAHIGHPLLGDSMYGGPVELLQRHALHSSHLELIHPFTEEKMAWDSEMAADLAQILRENE